MAEQVKNNFTPTSNPSEENPYKSAFKKIVSLFNIANYIKMEWDIILHPKKTIDKLIRNKKPSWEDAGGFLLFNILLAKFGGKFIGYELKEFPFKIPLLPDYVISYALGIIVFLILLVLAGPFRKYNKQNTLLPKAFSAICYASAIFLPLILTKQVCEYLFSGSFINIFTSILSHVPFQIGIKDCLGIFVFFLAVPVFFSIWWLWLVYLGFKSLQIVTPGRLKWIITSRYIIFLFVQATITLLVIIMPIFTPLDIIAEGKIEKALSTNPPNYFKAALLAQSIAENEGMVPYIRYAAKIKAVTYTIATPIWSINDKYIVNKALKDIANRDYTEVEDMLNKYLNSLLADETNPKRPFYVMLIDQLKKAREFRNLPGYVSKQTDYSLAFFDPPIQIALLPEGDFFNAILILFIIVLLIFLIIILYNLYLIIVGKQDISVTLVSLGVILLIATFFYNIKRKKPTKVITNS